MPALSQACWLGMTAKHTAHQLIPTVTSICSASMNKNAYLTALLMFI
ncbi:TPA: hypothetical protein R5S02_004129 [Salmonella enterica]|nr:hypothetical protein [Salmonella enterica]